MRAIDTLELNKELAKQYREVAQDSLERNRHMNEIEQSEKVQQRHIDAVLVDFINFIASKHCIDYGLYTSDIKQ